MSSLGFDRLVVDCRDSKVASYQELGLTSKAPSTNTGLTGGNAYQFKVNTVNYTVTMPSGTVTYLDLIKAINATAAIQAATIRAILVGGDVRFYIYSATITIAAGDSADLLAALSSTPDSAVNAIMMIEFPISSKRAMINAISVNFPIFYNDDLIWELIRTVVGDGEEYNQRFSATVSTSASYHKEDLITPCGGGDKVIVSTEAACAGTSYVTLAWSCKD